MAFLRSSDPDTHGPSEGACFLYVLPCAYEDLLKLGFSRHPLERMQALHPRYYEFFDLDRALLVETDTVRDARDLELRFGRALTEHGAPSPLTVRREAAGHTEWYRGAYRRLADEARQLRAQGHVVHEPLRPWLRKQLENHAQGLYDWAVALLESVQHEPAQLDAPELVGLRRRVVDALDAYVALDLDLDQHLPPALSQWQRMRVR
ncbi:GIY-YIG nuclease family protein [Lysobacter panacisoli]|uniref:GIY-YIG nuclease family protein n=1 Tax=Lysobacter panacisoli TaxID=1255263 RepID=A0ABP9L9Q4_9GAMM|nr:GIY-YIG nuclease family protein [Lysobacter panacisoli]